MTCGLCVNSKCIELSEYIIKRESLNQNFGKEGNSWKRVAEKMTGAKGTKVKI